MTAGVQRFCTYILGFASLFLIWHVCSSWIMPSVLFPTPWKVFLKAIELAQDGTLWEQASASLGRIASGTNFYAGSLDEIAVYNTALSATVVAGHYAAR